MARKIKTLATAQSWHMLTKTWFHSADGDNNWNDRSIFASLLRVWWERSSGTWHGTLNVNRTTWSLGPFRWSLPPHKSVNKGQKHTAAHALRACSARSLSASRFAPLYIPQDSTCHQLWRPQQRPHVKQGPTHRVRVSGLIQKMASTNGLIGPFCVLVARVVGTEFGYMACAA